MAFAAGVAICDHEPAKPVGERSRMKPVSLLELSVQVRLICVLEIAVAAGSLGALGAVGAAVVALAVFESTDVAQAELVARTR